MSDAHFLKGQWVEVSSEEEGFRGAWFVAKIISLPLESNDASSSASKSKIKRKNEFLIEYQSMMEDEEGTKPLREYVHTSFTRPLPPKEPVRVFEVNEFVDAFDRDGWWKGVITEVLEEELKYVVYFKSTEEELEFSQSDLRVHLEWVDGQWSKPRKQEQQQQKEMKQKDAEGSKKDVKKRGRPPKQKSTTGQGKVVSKSTEIDKQGMGSSKKKRRISTADKVKNKGSGLKAFSPQATYDADMSITEVLRDFVDEFQLPPVTDNEDGILDSKSNNAAAGKDPSFRAGILRATADEHQSSPIIDNKGISPDGILDSKSKNTAAEEDSSVTARILRDTADEHKSSPIIDNKGISTDSILDTKSSNADTEEDPSVSAGILKDTADEHQPSPKKSNFKFNNFFLGPEISPDSILDSKSNNADTVEGPSVRARILRDTANDHQSSPMIDNKDTEEDPSVKAVILRATADEHQSSPIIDNTGISPDGILDSKSKNTAGEANSSVTARILRDTADEHKSSPIIDNKGISTDSILDTKSSNAYTEEDPSVSAGILRDTADEHQPSPKKSNFKFNNFFLGPEISPDSILDSKPNNADTEEGPSVRARILRDTADDHQSSPIIDNKDTKEDPSVKAVILRDTADERQSSPIIDNKGISVDGILDSKSNDAATEEVPSVRAGILRDTADELQSSPMMDNKGISPDKISHSNEVATKEDKLLKDLDIPESFNLAKSLEEDACMGCQCNDAIIEQNEVGPVSVDSKCSDSYEVNKVSLMAVYKRCDKANAIQNQMTNSSVKHTRTKEHYKVNCEAPVIVSTNDKASVENESLPFVKTPSLWEIISSMEIYKKMPQNPHFRPLKQYNTAQAEGMAVGLMVTFANVVAKTLASHIDDPRRNLEEWSTTLVDLEAHGFSVQAIQSRVQRLLEMKDKHLMLEKKSKEAEVKMTELKNEKETFKTQLVKIKEDLKFHEEATIRLKNDCEVLMKEMGRNGSESSVCQMELDATANTSKTVRLEYPNIVAGPL